MNNEESKTRRNNWIKFGITAAAVGVGTYYGAGRHVRKISKDVRVLTKQLNMLGEFLVAEAEFQEAFRKAQRDVITAAQAANVGFTHYPGLGVITDLHSLIPSK